MYQKYVEVKWVYEGNSGMKVVDKKRFKFDELRNVDHFVFELAHDPHVIKIAKCTIEVYTELH